MQCFIFILQAALNEQQIIFRYGRKVRLKIHTNAVVIYCVGIKIGYRQYPLTRPYLNRFLIKVLVGSYQFECTRRKGNFSSFQWVFRTQRPRLSATLTPPSGRIGMYNCKALESAKTRACHNARSVRFGAHIEAITAPGSCRMRKNEAPPGKLEMSPVVSMAFTFRPGK